MTAILCEEGIQARVHRVAPENMARPAHNADPRSGGVDACVFNNGVVGVAYVYRSAGLNCFVSAAVVNRAISDGRIMAPLAYAGIDMHGATLGQIGTERDGLTPTIQSDAARFDREACFRGRHILGE